MPGRGREKACGRGVVLFALVLLLVAAGPELAEPAGAAVTARASSRTAMQARPVARSSVVRHRTRRVRVHRHAKRHHRRGTNHRRHSSHARKRVVAAATPVAHKPMLQHPKIVKKVKPVRQHRRVAARPLKQVHPKRHARAHVHAKKHHKKKARGTPGPRHYAMLFGLGAIGMAAIYFLTAPLRQRRARALAYARE